MPCVCDHEIRKHDWNLHRGQLQPCTKCDCKDYKEEPSNWFYGGTDWGSK